MPAPAAKPPLSEDAAFRRDYAGYLAQRMGPMIHALMALALCAYLLAVARVAESTELRGVYP